MEFSARSLLVLLLLGGALATQTLVKRHVATASATDERRLPTPLDSLPLQLPHWRGEEREISDPRLRLGDARIRRLYQRGRSGPVIEVWAVYAQDGSDRFHHPEICMAVAGHQEDQAGRQTIPVPGHSAPVQQYRFGSPGKRKLVYYWHYSLLAPQDDGRDGLQRLYERLHRRPPSLTIQVFVPEQGPRDREQAVEFVREFDAALQAALPPTAERGSRRAPVTIVD